MQHTLRTYPLHFSIPELRRPREHQIVTGSQTRGDDMLLCCLLCLRVKAHDNLHHKRQSY